MSPRSGIPSSFTPTRVLGLLATTAALSLVAAPATSAAGLAEPGATPRAATAKKKAPKLRISVSGVPKGIKRQHGYVAKVRVKNVGTAVAKQVQLRIGRTPGVTIRPRGKTKWSSLQPAKSRLVKVRLTLAKRAKASAKVRLRATGAGRLRATKTIVLRVGTSTKKPGPPSASANPLVGKYFWGFKVHVDYAWDTHGVFFVSDGWAYRGLPKGGLPHCTATTTVLGDDGQPTGDGCFPFRYDAGTGAVTVGPYAGSYTGGKLRLEDLNMSPLAIPPAGSRYQTALEHQGFRGFCGLMVGCTTWHKSLGLTGDGQFVDSSSSLSTFGGVGTPFVAAGNYPPEEYGTYQVLSGGRIQLSYANGTVQVRTIGIELGASGQPDPVGEGLLLDATNYYPATD